MIGHGHLAKDPVAAPLQFDRFRSREGGTRMLNAMKCSPTWCYGIGGKRSGTSCRASSWCPWDHPVLLRHEFDLAPVWCSLAGCNNIRRHWA